MYFRDGTYTGNTKGFLRCFELEKIFRKMALMPKKMYRRLNECYQRVLQIIWDKKFFDDRLGHVTPPTPSTPLPYPLRDRPTVTSPMAIVKIFLIHKNSPK